MSLQPPRRAGLAHDRLVGQQDTRAIIVPG